LTRPDTRYRSIRMPRLSALIDPSPLDLPRACRHLLSGTAVRPDPSATREGTATLDLRSSARLVEARRAVDRLVQAPLRLRARPGPRPSHRAAVCPRRALAHLATRKSALLAHRILLLRLYHRSVPSTTMICLEGGNLQQREAGYASCVAGEDTRLGAIALPSYRLWVCTRAARLSRTSRRPCLAANSMFLHTNFGQLRPFACLPISHKQCSQCNQWCAVSRWTSSLVYLALSRVT
jgi:hypothetical protein